MSACRNWLLSVGENAQRCDALQNPQHFPKQYWMNQTHSSTAPLSNRAAAAAACTVPEAWLGNASHCCCERANSFTHTPGRRRAGPGGRGRAARPPLQWGGPTHGCPRPARSSVVLPPPAAAVAPQAWPPPAPPPSRPAEQLSTFTQRSTAILSSINFRFGVTH